MHNYVEKGREQRKEALNYNGSKGFLWKVEAFLMALSVASLNVTWTLLYPLRNFVGLCRYHYYKALTSKAINDGLSEYEIDNTDKEENKDEGGSE